MKSNILQNGKGSEMRVARGNCWPTPEMVVAQRVTVRETLKIKKKEKEATSR